MGVSERGGVGVPVIAIEVHHEPHLVDRSMSGEQGHQLIFVHVTRYLTYEHLDRGCDSLRESYLQPQRIL